MMVQLPLKFPTEFYIANMNNYYAPLLLPRSSTDHQYSVSCKNPRSFDFPVLPSSSPVRNNSNSSRNSNGKKPSWFRPYFIFPWILGPPSSSASTSKYRLTACFYKKKNIPCRGPAPAVSSVPDQAKSDQSIFKSSTDSSLGERRRQPILTNVSSKTTKTLIIEDHPSSEDDDDDDMLDDIDRKMAGVCMDQESNIHIVVVQDMMDTATSVEEANIAAVSNGEVSNADHNHDDM